MPKVSVIIPVYNTDLYLEKCLDSVLNQTLTDIEIICVNDCSTDKSLSILKKYSKNDNRIKIIDLDKNHGPGYARNKGIDFASGEYLGFIDSDDSIDLDFFERLYQKAQETKSDIVKGNYQYESTGIQWSINEKIKEAKSNFLFGYCSAIFRNALIKKHNLCFPNLTNMEDPVFAFSAAINANRITIISDANVHVTTRSDSQTKSTPTIQKIKDTFTGLSCIIDIANHTDISEASYAYCLSFLFNANFLYCILNTDKKVREFVARNIINLYDEVIYKQSFLNQLEIKNEFLAVSLANKKTDYLLNYEQMRKIYNIRKTLKNA